MSELRVLGPLPGGAYANTFRHVPEDHSLGGGGGGGGEGAGAGGGCGLGPAHIERLRPALT